jgi:hypothetical protein
VLAQTPVTDWPPGAFAGAVLPSSEVYNESMARGWESKSVEAQIELASERDSSRVTDATGREIARQRESLLLDRTRVLREISECRNPRYMEQLKRSLEHLDEQLRGLDLNLRPWP